MLRTVDSGNDTTREGSVALQINLGVVICVASYESTLHPAAVLVLVIKFGSTSSFDNFTGIDPGKLNSINYPDMIEGLSR